MPVCASLHGMVQPRIFFNTICFRLHLHLEKDQCHPGHDYMLYFAVTFLIKEQTHTEDVEQMDSQLVCYQEQNIYWLHVFIHLQ